MKDDKGFFLLIPVCIPMIDPYLTIDYKNFISKGPSFFPIMWDILGFQNPSNCEGFTLSRTSFDTCSLIQNLSSLHTHPRSHLTN